MTAEIPVVHLGPTWQRNDDGTFALPPPERSLGWQIIQWVEDNLLNFEGERFILTLEQQRFLIHWYEIDDRGRFVYRSGVLQRLKGWGKDPLAAVIAAVEFVGPCRFSYWDDDGMPVLVDNPNAWVQIVATSVFQTRTTFTLFPSLFNAACKERNSIDIGKELIYAYHGARRIEAVTSNPRSMEGARPSFILANETQHWLSTNGGHEMASVIERNATKVRGGAARTLAATNAPEPSENSVAQQQREAYEAEKAGLSIDTGFLYDSLEAAPEVGLRPARKPGDPEPTEEEIKAYLSAVISAVRGDSSWLDVETIVRSILNVNNPPSKSRRFWLNQIVADEDAWLLPAAVDAAESPAAAQERRSGVDILRAGWLVLPEEESVMFFDGSKSIDATGIVLCRVSDGYVFTGGVWQRPLGERGKSWLVPRDEVDARVAELFDRFNIVAFWGDPSHAKEDVDSSRYWDGLIDDWHRTYKERLRHWAIKTTANAHSIMWDMTSPERTKSFVAAAEVFVEELETADDLGMFRPLFFHDGHPALKQHLKNARQAPGRYGASLMKASKESDRKIDLAVAAVGARMLRRAVMLKDEPDRSEPGTIWGYV